MIYVGIGLDLPLAGGVDLESGALASTDVACSFPSCQAGDLHCPPDEPFVARACDNQGCAGRDEEASGTAQCSCVPGEC